MMKMILRRVLAVTAVALTVGATGLAQGTGDSAPKGGGSAGGYENYSFTMSVPETLWLMGFGVGVVVFFALRPKQ